MKKALLSILIFCSLNISAKDIDTYPAADILPLPVYQLSDDTIILNIPNSQDLAIKEDKINRCISTYIEKQTRYFSKITQNNLYDLMNSFDRIISKIYGKKPDIDNTPYNEKIESLAKTQCETYFHMGILK